MFTSPEGTQLVDLLEKHRVAAKVIYCVKTENPVDPRILLLRHVNDLWILPGGRVDLKDYSFLRHNTDLPENLLNVLRVGLLREVVEEITGLNCFYSPEDVEGVEWIPRFVIPWTVHRKGTDSPEYFFGLDYVGSKYVDHEYHSPAGLKLDKNEITDYVWVNLADALNGNIDGLANNTYDSLEAFSRILRPV